MDTLHKGDDDDDDDNNSSSNNNNNNAQMNKTQSITTILDNVYQHVDNKHCPIQP